MVTFEQWRARRRKAVEDLKRWERLRSDPDFCVWLEQIDSFRSEAMAKLLAATTRGYGHDLIKAFIRVLDSVKANGPAAAIDRLMREVHRLDAQGHKYMEEQNG